MSWRMLEAWHQRRWIQVMFIFDTVSNAGLWVWRLVRCYSHASCLLSQLPCRTSRAVYHRQSLTILRVAVQGEWKHAPQVVRLRICPQALPLRLRSGLSSSTAQGPDERSGRKTSEANYIMSNVPMLLGQLRSASLPIGLAASLSQSLQDLMALCANAG